MSLLYLTEQGSKLSKSGDRLIVRSPDGELRLEIECRHVEAVLIFGNVQFTTQACVEMLSHGIEMALLTLSGKLHGQLTPPRPKNIDLRLRQYQIGAASEEHPEALALAREMIAGKIEGAVSVLRGTLKNYPDDALRRMAADLEAAAARALAAPDMATLRGVEGAAARAYFGALAACCRGELVMQGRSSRPPLDPMNALLSFGYTLLGFEIAALIDAVGLDPYIGFFHSERHGRPALALDLLEEFRHPCVDRFCLTLNNQRVLKNADFQQAPDDDFAQQPPPAAPAPAPAPPAQPSGLNRVCPSQAGSEVVFVPADPSVREVSISAPPAPAPSGFRLTPPALKVFLARWNAHLNQPQAHVPGAPPRSWRQVLRAQVERLAASVRSGAPYHSFIRSGPSTTSTAPNPSTPSTLSTPSALSNPSTPSTPSTFEAEP